MRTRIWLGILLICFARQVLGADSDLGGPGAETAFFRGIKTNWTPAQIKARLQVWTNLFDPIYFNVTDGTNVSLVPPSTGPVVTNIFDPDNFTVTDGTNVHFKIAAQGTNFNFYGNTTNFGTLYGFPFSPYTNVFDTTYFLITNGTNVSAKPNAIVADSTDSRLSDARTPLAHANTHTNGGTDSIRLDTLAAPTDNTSNNATASAHGLIKKLSGNATDFFNGAGNWAVPPDTGEVNTASNVGTVGTGIFKQKSLLDLQFYKINSIDSKLTIALNGTDRIDFTVNSDAVVAASTDSRLSDSRTPTLHNVLDSTKHGDVLTGSIARGDLLVGNSTPKIAKFAIGTGFLHGNGTDVDSWRLLAYADLAGLYNTNLFDTTQFALTTGTNVHIKDGVLLTNAAFYGRATNNGSAWTVAEGGSGAATLTGILQGNGTSPFTAINGTTNFVPKWSATPPYLTDSMIRDITGTGVGIGITPVVPFQIQSAAANSYVFRITSSGANTMLNFSEHSDGSGFMDFMSGIGALKARVAANLDSYVPLKFGVGTATPDRMVEILDASNNAQLRLTYYDAASYAELFCNYLGDLIITPSSKRVGINRVPALFPLEVEDLNYDTPLRLVTGSAGAGGCYIYFQNTNTATAGTFFGSTQTRFGMWTDNIERMVVDVLGRVGIGTTSPRSRLHIAGSTTATNTAPLKFDSGTLMTTPEVGAHEFLTDDFFLTITTGAARKGIILDDGARLTSGRVPIATTNGRLTDDADLTFSGDTLTVTKIVSGPILTPVLVKTTNYTLVAGDDMILGDAANSNVVFTLPAIVDKTEYTIKRINGGTNTVTIQSTANKLIDLTTNFTLSVLMQSVTVKASSVKDQWYIK